MTVISDVFSFAAQNADYWVEFLSGYEYPTELTEEEIRALTAARTHIDAIVIEILHSAGEKIAETLGKDKIKKQRFKPAITSKNRSIRLSAPFDLQNKIYSIQFSLDRNETGCAIELYASLVVKKGALDALRVFLDDHNIKYGVDGYYVYAPGLPIKINTDIDELADQSAKQAIQLCYGDVEDIVEG